MRPQDIIQKGNSLSARISISDYNKQTFEKKTSPEFVINGSAVFQMLLEIASDNCRGVIVNYIFVRFTKLRPKDDLTYTITFTSKELHNVHKRFTCDDGAWHLLSGTTDSIKQFNMSVHMDVLPLVNSFASLHDDSELTDFELRGTDGAVRVHRAVLAAASPVLRRMLSGAWRETDKGNVEVSGTTLATLQHLKDYLYLHTLPESGLEQLLLLSSCYMMPDLEQKCVDKLVHDMSAANACDMIEFAATHKMKRLLLAILRCVQSGSVSVTDMDKDNE